MRVVIDARVLGRDLPGISRATLGLLRGLRSIDHDHELVVAYARRHEDRLDPLDLRADGRFDLVPVDVEPNRMRGQRGVAGLPELRPRDLWHAPWPVRPLRAGRVVVTAYDLITPRAASGRRSLRRHVRWETRLRVSLGTATHVIVPSAATRDALRRRLRIPAERVSVVPLAPEVHGHDGAAAGEPYVLYLGTNKRHKNVGALVRAWKLLADRGETVVDGRPVRLVLAGHQDTSLPTFRQEFGDAQALGLRFREDVADEELPRLLGEAACFAFPSLEEGFGLPPLEAMACGTPVVASNRASLPEVLDRAALMVDPTPEAFADGLRRVLHDPALRERLTAAGRERAAGFGWERTAAATLAAYERAGARS